MSEKFNLENYLTNGVKNIIKEAIKISFFNKAASSFMLKFGVYAKKASKIRQEAEISGEHIPAFLIASITSSCNLHCSGCYARSNKSCSDSVPTCQLTANEWKCVFLEARDMGVSFILLAGGEPLIRDDVIEIAAQIPQIMFPIFTNGTMVDEKYIELFKKKRNLIPIMSIEGNKEKTDNRRGNGIYNVLIDTMNTLKKESVIFGVSITVTNDNLQEVLSESFINKLKELGCKVIIYVEYVPVSDEFNYLAPGNTEREYIKQQLDIVRKTINDILIAAFPGDEGLSGGCLAAGRGFFHINSHGGAEPCPFSPYSDVNVKDMPLKEILHSKLFEKLRRSDLLNENHIGGCVLFENQDTVKKFILDN